MRMRRRGNWRDGFVERFGRYTTSLKQAITNRHTIWMHAVSVGEVNVCTQLIRALEPRLPNLKIVVSTTTTTGMERLHEKLPTHISKVYYPIDRRLYVGRALGTVRPEAIVLIEAEIWPNFLWKARDMRIPTFLVNARLSQRSYKGYKRFGILFRQLFASFSGVGAQNDEDARRLKELGCRESAVEVVGSLKFDAVTLHEKRRLDVPAMLRQLCVPEGAPVLLGGSTHDGEERLLGEQFLRLRQTFPNLFLVLVPRHFERCREVGRELSSLGIKFAYRNEITAQSTFKPGEIDCLLVNTTGELTLFYEVATVVFVGKSITAEGGQNPIEPAGIGKAVVFGPNMQNFEDIVRILLAQDGAVQVASASDLEKKIAELLANRKRCEELGRNGMLAVRENQGAIERTVEMILKHLEGGELYIAPR